jgi:hypothetical protein
MTVIDFISQYVQHNSLVRLVYKNPNGHKTVLNDWSDVSMEHEITKGRGKFAAFTKHEVVGVASILTPGSYADAINIVIEEKPKSEIRNDKLEELGL